jgi:uncharacterized protein YbcC (UPF0753/DUF2309 family)
MQNHINEAARCLNPVWPLSNFIANNVLKEFEGMPFGQAVRLAHGLFGGNGYLPMSEYVELKKLGRISDENLGEARANAVASAIALARQSADSCACTACGGATVSRVAAGFTCDGVSCEDFKDEVAGAAGTSIAESTGTNEATNIANFVWSISESLDFERGSRLVAIINKQMIKWCVAYYDHSQADWTQRKNSGLYLYWRQLMQHDHVLDLHGVRKWKAALNQLSPEPETALAELLDQLGVPEGETVPYLRRQLLHLSGWTRHLKWRQSNSEESALAEFLVLRLFYELQLSKGIPAKSGSRPGVSGSLWHMTSDARSRLDDGARLERQALEPRFETASVWQDAFELNFRDRLIGMLRDNLAPAAGGRQIGGINRAPDARLFFCIDVRSEPIRRALDQLGPYRTDGFAGFWGFATQFKELFGALSISLCPVLVKTDKHVHEVTTDKRAKRLASHQAFAAAFLQLQKKLKGNLAGAFGLVESFGMWSLFPLLMRTLSPKLYKALSEQARSFVSWTPKTNLDVSAFSTDELVSLAEANMKAMGLTEFAPVIVLCGHRSKSTNNAHAAALECGACGGHAGEYSAKLAVQVLSDPRVREGLKARGVNIPDETVFLAGEHITTTDELELFESDAFLTPDQEEIVARLKYDLKVAGKLARLERQKTLPQSACGTFNEPTTRADDWAQVAPEWGLTHNAAFIAARMETTRGLNFQGRSFLHSYDQSKDSLGKVLELIMTAPMIVAQWINSQYYFSTTDNEVYGSGSKVLHNVVGDFGVMSGNSSDLRIGLPRQSVMNRNGVREHEPMRLLVVIESTTAAIDVVLRKHAGVASLVNNRWIRLVALDSERGAFLQAEKVGVWRSL